MPVILTPCGRATQSTKHIGLEGTLIYIRTCMSNNNSMHISKSGVHKLVHFLLGLQIHTGCPYFAWRLQFRFPVPSCVCLCWLTNLASSYAPLLLKCKLLFPFNNFVFEISSARPSFIYSCTCSLHAHDPKKRMPLPLCKPKALHNC